MQVVFTQILTNQDYRSWVAFPNVVILTVETLIPTSLDDHLLSLINICFMIRGFELCNLF